MRITFDCRDCGTRCVEVKNEEKVPSEYRKELVVWVRCVRCGNLYEHHIAHVSVKSHGAISLQELSDIDC